MPARILLTSGPGNAPIDGVRRITNHSTGALGARLAAAFHAAGHEVICLHGHGATTPCDPRHARVLSFVTNEDLMRHLAALAHEQPAPALVLHVAALCDYHVAEVTSAEPDRSPLAATGKLDSRAGSLLLRLDPAPKVITRLRAWFPSARIVGWKYELDLTPDQLVTRGYRQLADNHTDHCVLNGPAHGPGFTLLSTDADAEPLHHADTLVARLVSLLDQPPFTPAASAPLSMPNEHLRTASLAILDQGLDLLATLAPTDYGQPLPQAFNASIGGHYRHCLDHFECLLAAPGEAIDYDARRRDERVEREPAFAAERTRQLSAALRALPATRLDATISVRCKVAYTGSDSPLVPSTVARELMYAIVHAVHHYALIGVMCRLLELPLTPGFGIAPSTVQHRAAAPAA